MKIITLLLLRASVVLAATVCATWADPLNVTLMNAEGETVGDAKLTQTPTGVLIQLKFTKAPAGTHGFHIHEVGKCEPPFTSAGGHFNPLAKKHGLMSEEGKHVGDLPNIHIPENGALSAEVFAPDVTIKDGKTPLVDTDGSSLVLHADPDDYKTDPAGNAGKRIACGVIDGSSAAMAK
jgi:Cu-Zn family superoxide dismutase